MLKKYFLILLITGFFYSQQSLAEGEDYGSYLVSSYALDSGDIRGAAKYLETYIKDHPDDIDSIRKAYMVMAMSGDIEQAALFAKKDSGKDKVIISDLIIAIDEAKKKNYTQAQEYIKIFGKSNPAIELLNSFSMAWLLAGEKKYDEAIAVLQKVKNQSDLKSMYFLHSGMIHEISGNEQKALENYELAMVESNRLSPRGLQFAARNLIKNGKKNIVEKAVAKYEQDKISVFLSDYKNYLLDERIIYDDISIEDGLSEAFFNMASLFFQAGSNELAEILYSNALKISPDFYSLRLMFGELYEQSEDYTMADKMYSDFSLQSPFGRSAFVKKALMLEKIEKDSVVAKEKTEQALSYLSHAYPEIIALTLTYADYLKQQEKYDQAIIYYTKALNQIMDDEGNFPEKYWIALFSRAVAYERAGLWDLAENDFLKVLEISPDNPHSLNYLGYSWLVREKNQEKAIEMVKKAHEKQPYDGHIIDSLGWAYYLTGDYEKSQELLEKALDMLPDNSVILDHLGDVYWKVGRKLEAEFQWKKALIMDKDMEKDDPEKIKYKLKHGLDDFEKNYKKK